jgi:hypothetical protein
MRPATFVFGTRSDGLRGVFIAPPGVDADTAPVDQMALYYGALKTQLISKAMLVSSPTTIPLGFTTYTPIIFIHRFQEVDYGGFTLPGFVRPDANFWSPTNIMAHVTADSVTFSNANGRLFYYVLGRRAP